MPRYAILRHDVPDGTRHFDLLFERNGVLKAWRWFGPAWPPERFPAEVEEHVDHRPLYLDYEGPLTENRGAVRRVEGGEYEVLAWRDVRVEMRIGSLRWLWERTDRIGRKNPLWRLEGIR